MGSRNGFDTNLELDEIQAPVDRGSGAISIGQRQANALTNLGLNAGTVNPPGGFSGLIGAQGTNPVVLGVYNTAGVVQSVVDVEQYVTLTANYVLTDSAAAQKAFNGSTNGAVTLVAGKAYYFE